MLTIEAQEQEIIEEFSLFDDALDRYEHLIDLGKNLPLIDPAYQNDEHKLRGCQSKVWLHAWMKDGRLYFTANSDAAIPKGLIALLIRVFNGQQPIDIINAELSFLDKLNMQDQLSPQRKNGLNAMIKKIKHFAFQNIEANN